MIGEGLTNAEIAEHLDKAGKRGRPRVENAIRTEGVVPPARRTLRVQVLVRDDTPTG